MNQDEVLFKNLAAMWRKWKQTMQLYLHVVMSGKTEEQQYSTFLFVIGEKLDDGIPSDKIRDTL